MKVQVSLEYAGEVKKNELDSERTQLSQAAACDGLVYSVNYNGQNSGTQAHDLPLLED